MIRHEDIPALAREHWADPQGPWFYQAAAKAVARGHWWTFPGRNHDGVYLVRMWLSKPQESDDRRPTGCPYDSHDSIVLHYFVHADDDGALHDHPMDFDSVIVHGGYEEYLPDEAWLEGDRVLGPVYGGRSVMRLAGDTISHKGPELHAVGRLLGETWSMVRTGPKYRPWGFHPAGQIWVPAARYLNLES